MKNDKDVEILKIEADSVKHKTNCQVLKHVVTCITYLVAVFLFFKGLEPFLSAKPDVLTVLEKIIDKLNFFNCTAYFLCGLVGVAWKLERNGKKRAIKEKSKYQSLLEQKDLYRSSSGLTKTGETPKEK